MFLHNFKNSLKVILKNKMLIFWTFAFPILLGVFFKMAFSDIESSEKLNIIDIAVINNEDFKLDYAFKSALDSLSEGENKIFNISYVSLDKAKEKLKNDEIIGYLYLENGKSNIVVNSSGVNETIFRYAIDQINSNKKMYSDLVNSGVKEEEILNILKISNVDLNNVSRSNLSYTMIEYYTLIAMSCMYGGLISMFILNKRLGNMCDVGKRTAVSPVNKFSLIMGSLCASFVIQLIGVFLLFIFTKLVLNVDYGSFMGYVVLLSVIGSVAGLSIGVIVATVIKSNENVKTGILIAITMLGCFLSGMMGITMKYIIDKYVPLINKINPVAMLTDGFYSLYYYGVNKGFVFDTFSLILFSFIMIFISYLVLRRQKYDSI